MVEVEWLEGQGRVSGTTCQGAYTRPAKSLAELALHQTRSFTQKQNGLHLYRLAALSGRKRILLQLRDLFSLALDCGLCSPDVLRP